MEIDKPFNDLKLINHDCNELNFEPEVEDIISTIAKKEGFTNYNVEKKLLSNVGGNYLGILYEVNIKSGKKELNLFLKKIIMGDKITFLSVAEAYTKEIFVYDELSKIFNEIQAKATVPVEHMFEIVKCYGVFRKLNSETLFLENLTKKGYITCDRFESINLKFAELAIVDLAKFHALGFVLERKRPRYFERKIKPLKPPFIINDKWKDFITSITDNTLQRLDCKEIKSKVEKFVEDKMVNNFDAYYKPTKFSTLCHGDFRANNVLVKEKNGKFIKTMVVDYQLIYYGCPINDFLYFIFGATDQKFREKHLVHLKNLYYTTLKEFLNNFNCDIEYVYPKKEFEREYRNRLDFGLAMALLVLPFIVASEGDVPDFAETEITDMKISENEDTLFKERILGVLDDYLKWGYL